MNNKTKIFLQICMVTLYSFITMFAKNPGETGFSDFFFASLFALCFTFLTFFFSNLAFKNFFKTGVFTTFFIFIFLNIGHFAGYLGGVKFLGVRIFRWKILLLLVSICLVFLFVYLLFSKKKQFFMAYGLSFPFMILNLYLATIIGVGLYSNNNLIRKYEANGTFHLENFFDSGGFSNDTLSLDYPDIYFIILDAYGSHNIIKKYYGYDNSLFLNSLRAKGFNIPENSHSNYVWTNYSIAATLNMNYWDEHNEASPASLLSLSEHIVLNNNVCKILKSQGYKIINIRSITGFVNGMSNCTQSVFSSLWNGIFKFFQRPWYTSDFLYNLMAKTAIWPFLEKSVIFSGLRKEIKRQLRELKEVSCLKGPKFVFSHLLCPHEPFLFASDGSSVDDSVLDIRNYAGQVEFITREIDKVIDHILISSKSDPIIIFQSDHGIGTEPWGAKDGFTDKTFCRVKNRFYFLNAYRFPEGKFPDRLLISPVNNFRILFNYLFNFNFEILEDEAFVGPNEAGRFRKVTHLLYGSS